MAAVLTTARSGSHTTRVWRKLRTERRHSSIMASCMNRVFAYPEEWFGAVYQGVFYGDRFEVSTYGRLRNAKTAHIYACGYGEGGYLQACISICGKRLNVRPHRCVAETLIENPYGYEIVNHLDGCKQHNDVWNLEWCTRPDNYRHALMMELVDPDVPAQLGRFSSLGVYSGSVNGMSKLTEADVLEIRARYVPKGKGSKCNRKELADAFGVSPNLISKIVRHEIWTHI